MPKKILLVSGDFLPGKNGGIENYVFWLANILKSNNFEVEIAALDVKEKKDYVYEGLKVHYLNRSLVNFENLLQFKLYDICHFHEYAENGGIEIPWFKKAKENCKKVFFTFHLPYLTCYKNDFRYKGKDDCNTFNDPERCADCILTEKLKTSFGFALGSLLMKLKPAFSGVLNKFKDKVNLKHHYLNELIITCDKVFVIANWFEKILFSNGYQKINVKKIPNKPSPGIAENLMTNNEILKNKILFIGRIQPQKGLHLLCKAMNIYGSKNVTLDVYGNKIDENYFDACKKEYSFNYKGTVNREYLLDVIKNYDFLVLPSVFTEMYPLVIIDAFHRHLPVIASAAKGNVDVINEGENGFLFNYDDYKDLAKVINNAYSLKENGWQPKFENNDTNNESITEILSYYA